MKRALAVVLPFAVWFVLGEVGATWWLKSFGNALDLSRPLLQADADLGWKQKAFLKTTFFGTAVETNEWGWRTFPISEFQREGRRILVLGPSSTFGWGVEADQTYAHLIGKRLEALSLNAGEIGYSTFQGLRLLEMVIAEGWRFDDVVFAYGVNDVDRFRFYFQSARSDAQEFAVRPPEGAVRGQNLVNATSLGIVLLKTAAFLKAVIAPGSGRLQGMENDPVPPLRVSETEFRENLVQFVRRAKELGMRPVLLSSGFHLPAPSEGDSGENESLYRSSAEAFARGDAKAGSRLFEEARQREPLRVRRDIIRFNQVVREVARQESTILGDVEAWFTGQDQAALFVDPVHPSAEGHRQIAEKLSALLK